MYRVVTDVNNDCKGKFFHTCEYRCEYYIEYKHKKSRDVLHFTMNGDFGLFSSQFSRLSKKVEEYKNTKKVDTNSME